MTGKNAIRMLSHCLCIKDWITSAYGSRLLEQQNTQVQPHELAVACMAEGASEKQCLSKETPKKLTYLLT